MNATYLGARTAEGIASLRRQPRWMRWVIDHVLRTHQAADRNAGNPNTPAGQRP